MSQVCLSIMVSIPGTNKGIDEDEAPLEAVRKMKTMLTSLNNKIPSVKVGPWIGSESKKDKLLSKLPEDIDLVERYVSDFNRFISPDPRAYCRIHLYYGDKINMTQIELVIQGFKKTKVQFLQPGHSNIISPITMELLIGLPKEISTSKEFYQKFRQQLGLKHLGLWWTQPRAENTGTYTKTYYYTL